MATFPSIRLPDFKTTPVFYKPRVQTEFEGNYIQSRARATRGRHKWTLNWSYMSETNYQTLETFFNDNIGNSFTWTHPVTSTSYTCVFGSDNITCDEQIPGFRSGVSIQIEEV